MKNIKHVFVLIVLVVFASCSVEENLQLEDELNQEDIIQEELSDLKGNLLYRSNGVKGISGFNWSDGRDNFVDGWIIPSGISASDSYATISSVSNTVFTTFQNAGANTVRLGINPETVLEASWWNRYKAIINTATNRGMMVILGCWEGDSSRDGRVDNTTQFNNMWQKVVSDYSGNSQVLFEPFNEPHGYSTSELVALYRSWLRTHTGFAKNRVLLGGTGYSENVVVIGNSFPNCLLSQHLYAWWGNYTNPTTWENELASRIGNHANRTVLTEFGVPMTTGKNFAGPINGDFEVAFMKGITNYCRNNNLASVYWPGLRNGDSFTVYTYSNGNMNLTNQSGLKIIQYGWGNTFVNGYHSIQNRNSELMIDVNGGSSTNGANVLQWPWNGNNNQQWQLIPVGNYYRIVNRNSGLDLDVQGGSTTNGGNILQWPYSGGQNQQWNIINLGNGYCRIVNRNSGLDLDVQGGSTANGGNIVQWPWNGNTNQQWRINVR